ncbi:hypothetical protein EW093_15505 [Thiospirochaeta perfilievii]|uniref:DUF2802 domain-containing protein n=1 Tax=Thiospirochaeta perfilievii TaxID=252967 RepID=A0A5C1QF44_9SPIO|nr:hypothetical protein [Thiospirochaeta perfilievii]QEN06037.1 hypothetical protein EW093_15505 [Thiospirochaeta perfilievii]
MNTVLICLIVCSVYSIIIYGVLNSKINKKIDNKSFMKDVRNEINSLITQINETSDRNVLLIENRLERLNDLLAVSDINIANLKSINKAKEVESVTPEISEDKVVAKAPIEIEEVIIDNIEKQSVIDDKSLTRRERILLLHKQGISPTIIASQTKATIGEVELIISLSRG